MAQLEARLRMRCGSGGGQATESKRSAEILFLIVKMAFITAKYQSMQTALDRVLTGST